MVNKIDFKFYDNICLFFQVNLGKLFCCKKFWKNRNKINWIYKISNDRINSEMNIINLIKIIREIKVLLDHFREIPEIHNKLLLDQ